MLSPQLFPIEGLDTGFTGEVAILPSKRPKFENARIKVHLPDSILKPIEVVIKAFGKHAEVVLSPKLPFTPPMEDTSKSTHYWLRWVSATEIQFVFKEGSLLGSYAIRYLPPFGCFRCQWLPAR